MYHFIERLHTLYGLLQDEQSKEIFQTRFAIDMEKSIPNVSRLVLQGSNKELFFLGWPQSQKDALKQEHKKIFLYGTGIAGRLLAEMLESEHIDFYGFCGRDAEEYPDGLLGKPVISSDELVAHKDEYCVVPAVIGKKAYMEISQFVREHNYPEKNLLGWADYNSMVEQYFEFPELYRRGTVFIDGGCCDCESSYRFAQWCEGEYSSIIAFEPDPDNYDKCCKKTQDAPLRNFQLVNAGLSSQSGTLAFNAQGTGQSHILFAESSAEYVADVDETDNKISIRTVAIDDIIGDRTVGFIKMDIEGAEFDALHGAKNTILRDKPHLAICVYHLRGDVFAIMDYLHQLLPEYRFWLRHYSPNDFETVLYASVDL
ncbi:MAG: FkbM family methyltransferase [Lachnospiraceae bacterium]|nr:FkbM family methyltransferase [Lachnospiraceae bacterium]